MVSRLPTRHQVTFQGPSGCFLSWSILPYPAYRCPAWRHPFHRASHESAPWPSPWGTSPPWAELSYTPPVSRRRRSQHLYTFKGAVHLLHTDETTGHVNISGASHPNKHTMAPCSSSGVIQVSRRSQMCSIKLLYTLDVLVELWWCFYFSSYSRDLTELILMFSMRHPSVDWFLINFHYELTEAHITLTEFKDY